MDIDVSEMVAFANDLGAAAVAAPIQTGVAVRKRTQEGYRTMRALAPVRTGHLRDSTYVRANGLEGEFGATAEYADIVDQGNSRQAPQPFITPAASQAERGLYADAELIASTIL